jgi:hypothetical protein
MIEVNDDDEDERLAAAYRLLCARTAHCQDYDNEAAGRSVPCGLSLCCRTSGVCREVPVRGHRVAHDAVVRHLHLPVTLAHSLMRLIDVPSIDVTYGA